MKRAWVGGGYAVMTQFTLKRIDPKLWFFSEASKRLYSHVDAPLL